MENFTYKEYTEEESRIYNEAMDSIMEGLEKGFSFADACGRLDIEDEELKGFIMDDALKIMIADMHFNKGLSLEHISGSLSVPLDLVKRAQREMLQDIEISTTQVYKSLHPDSPIGNA
jgi:predicted transposase YdaD